MPLALLQKKGSRGGSAVRVLGTSSDSELGSCPGSGPSFSTEDLCDLGQVNLGPCASLLSPCEAGRVTAATMHSHSLCTTVSSERCVRVATATLFVEFLGQVHGKYDTLECLGYCLASSEQ